LPNQDHFIANIRPAQLATAALGGASQPLPTSAIATADAKFSAATAIHPDAAPVITPGLVFPASCIAQLPLELYSTPGVDAAILVAVMGRLAGDMTRASFSVLHRESRQCRH